jgi:hypothetical protein
MRLRASQTKCIPLVGGLRAGGPTWSGPSATLAATNNAGNYMTTCIDGRRDSIAIGGRKRRWTLPVFIVDAAGFVIWALIAFSRDWI